MKRLRAELFPTIALIAVAAMSGPAIASDFSIYAGSPGGPEEIPEGISEIALFVASGSSGSSTGSPCVDGNGQELCGWMLDLEAIGEVRFTGFAPESSSSTIWNLEEGRLRANGGDHEGHLGDQQIGTLQIERTGSGAVRTRPEGKNLAVGADLNMADLSGGVLAVPEPGLSIGLISGFVLLLGGSVRRLRPRT